MGTNLWLAAAANWGVLLIGHFAFGWGWIVSAFAGIGAAWATYFLTGGTWSQLTGG